MMLVYVDENTLVNSDEVKAIRVQEMHDGTWEIDLERHDDTRHPSLKVYKTQEEAQAGLKKLYDKFQKVGCAVSVLEI